MALCAVLPGCFGGSPEVPRLLGTRCPGAEAGKGGLLEVPAPRLVDVPGQEAPAVGEPEGLEVVGGGGRGGVLVVAAARGQCGCDGVAPKLPTSSTPQQGYLPRCCAARVEQAGDGRAVVGHVASVGVAAEAGTETWLAWVTAGRGGSALKTSPPRFRGGLQDPLP